jgi:hypothetical protein
VAVALVGLILVSLACSHQPSVFGGGVSSSRARVVGRTTLAHWQRELRLGRIERPGLRFDNLSQTELRRRLDKAAATYDFDVVSVRFHQPKQLAPEVVVQTKHYLDLARSAGSILDRIDPKRNTGDDRTGWRFEGFYFRAQDEHGVPFFIVFHALRQTEPGGGQWARSERLYPFPHG